MDQQDEHLGWAAETRAKMISAQATSRTMQIAGAKAEELVAHIKNWLD